MNCSDLQNGIYVFLDGELDDTDTAAFDGHLNRCPECRALVDAESNFLGQLRGALPQQMAPDALKERIAQAIAAAPIPAPPEGSVVGVLRGPSRWLSWAALAAAVLLAVVAWRLIAGPSPGQNADAVAPVAPVERLVSESVASHERALPMEVRGSEAHVKDFLRTNLPFAAELPLVDQPGVELVGARLTRVAGRDAVLFNLIVDGERVTITQVVSAPTDPKPTAPAPILSTRDGYDVMTWRRRGLTHTLVGSGDNDGVRRIIRATYQPD